MVSWGLQELSPRLGPGDLGACLPGRPKTKTPAEKRQCPRMLEVTLGQLVYFSEYLTPENRAGQGI